LRALTEASRVRKYPVKCRNTAFITFGVKF
jgi:hypothetical protein